MKYFIIPSYMIDLSFSESNHINSVKAQIKSEKKAAKATDLVCDRITIEPRSSGVNNQPNRFVYIADGTVSKCKLAYSDFTKSRSGHKDAKRVYDFLGYTWQYFYDYHQTVSYDNHNAPMVATLRYDMDHRIEAIWNGGVMYFGEANQSSGFYSFTHDVEVIAHEFFHALILNHKKLNYNGESGALNESFADIFGLMVKQRVNGHNARESNWLFGENILEISNGQSLRSMSKPGLAFICHPTFGNDMQVAHYRDYIHTALDYGGVHLNSGIPNHAFFRASYEQGGNAWETMARIWYTALTEYMLPNSSFIQARDAIERAAFEQEGSGSKALKNVKTAWNAVGVF